jgi:hypothetical protein
LFNNKIKVGSIIEFNYKNETTTDFIRKIEWGDLNERICFNIS